jgi:hypothetical protein
MRRSEAGRFGMSREEEWEGEYNYSSENTRRIECMSRWIDELRDVGLYDLREGQNGVIFLVSCYYCNASMD